MGTPGMDSPTGLRGSHPRLPSSVGSPSKTEFSTQRGQSTTFQLEKKKTHGDFPGGPVVKNPSANAGDMEDSTCHGATKPVSHSY